MIPHCFYKVHLYYLTTIFMFLKLHFQIYYPACPFPFPQPAGTGCKPPVPASAHKIKRTGRANPNLFSVKGEFYQIFNRRNLTILTFSSRYPYNTRFLDIYQAFYPKSQKKRAQVSTKSAPVRQFRPSFSAGGESPQILPKSLFSPGKPARFFPAFPAFPQGH